MEDDGEKRGGVDAQSSFPYLPDPISVLQERAAARREKKGTPDCSFGQRSDKK